MVFIHILAFSCEIGLSVNYELTVRWDSIEKRVDDIIGISFYERDMLRRAVLRSST